MFSRLMNGPSTPRKFSQISSVLLSKLSMIWRDSEPPNDDFTTKPSYPQNQMKAYPRICVQPTFWEAPY